MYVYSHYDTRRFRRVVSLLAPTDVPHRYRVVDRRDADLLHPAQAGQARTHKLKRLVPTPNSYFMDVKCPGCRGISTVFSHAQTVVVCAHCVSCILAQPTGGKAKLTESCSFRKKDTGAATH